MKALASTALALAVTLASTAHAAAAGATAYYLVIESAPAAAGGPATVGAPVVGAAVGAPVPGAAPGNVGTAANERIPLLAFSFSAPSGAGGSFETAQQQRVRNQTVQVIAEPSARTDELARAMEDGTARPRTIDLVGKRIRNGADDVFETIELKRALLTKSQFSERDGRRVVAMTFAFEGIDVMRPSGTSHTPTTTFDVKALTGS